MAHGVFVDGVWHTEWYDAKATGGRFVPFEPVFRNWVTADGSPGPSGEGGFAAEPGRYHLYVSLACPYAHRTVIFRKLKKLEGAISMSILDPVMGDQGWEFSDGPGTIADTVNGKRRLYEIYLLANPRYTGRVIGAGALGQEARHDRQQRVAGDHPHAQFGVRVAHGDRADYYPAALRAAIDRINARVYNDVNIGVYKAGFATAQDVYEEALPRRCSRRSTGSRICCRASAFSLGDAADRGGLAAVHHARALRRRLLRPLQMQPAPHRRLSAICRLPARPLSGARHRRHREHRSHQAALLHAARRRSIRRASCRSGRRWIFPRRTIAAALRRRRGP